MSDILEKTTPELGTREAAYWSAAGLIYTAISAGCKPTKETFCYWLDVYYQARRAYEDEAAGPYLTEKDLRPIRDYLASIQSYMTVSAAAEPSSSAQQAPEAAAPGLDPFKGTPWAHYKRQQRDRLELLRKDGCTTAQLADTGFIGMSEILSILEGNKVPLKIYQCLEQAMDAWEAASLAET